MVYIYIYIVVVVLFLIDSASFSAAAAVKQIYFRTYSDTSNIIFKPTAKSPGYSNRSLSSPKQSLYTGNTCDGRVKLT